MPVEAPPPSKIPHLIQLLRIAHAEICKRTITGGNPTLFPLKMIEQFIYEIPESIREDINTASIRTTIENFWNQSLKESEVKYVARDSQVPVSYAAQIIRELDDSAEFTEEDLTELN